MQFVNPFDKRIACEEPYISPAWLSIIPVTSTSEAPTSSAGGSAVTPDIEPVLPYNPCWIRMNGTPYRDGPYDSFEAYSVGGTPTDKGWGWAGPWRIHNAYQQTLVASDFDVHQDGPVDGSPGGNGWATNWSADGGTVVPPVVVPSGMQIFLESSDFDVDADLTAIATWSDKTGLANGRDYLQVTAGKKPWVDAVRTLNGHNTIRFIYSTDVRWMSGGSNAWLTALTAADLFVVMKKDNDPAVLGTTAGDAGAPFQFNRQSTFASHVCLTDGNIYENFGNATRPSLGNPATSLASWCVYQLRNSNATNQLIVYVDTELVYSAAQTWQALGTTVNFLGMGVTVSDQFSFGGNLAAVYCFDHVLSGAERTSFDAYLFSKWGLHCSLV